ncbi:MAG: hypothetical protein VXW32_03495 [Myxococcota bacterium]|jgi:hypothetical protein|nr:hypothetical protein [Myxococcota bacterium]
MVGWLSILACIGVGSEETADPNSSGVDSHADTHATDPDTTGDDPAGPGEFEGAVVTENCTYRDYPYAVDILLSCGSERFGSELRLHTFKRHSHGHGRVFNDQRLTHRNQQLWFDGYAQPRCIRFTNDGRLMLESDGSGCSTVELIPVQDGFRIAEPATGRCAGLGAAECEDHAFTGGRECGGTEHRYLPLVMGDCSDALSFRVETAAETCAEEYPENSCF